MLQKCKSIKFKVQPTLNQVKTFSLNNKDTTTCISKLQSVNQSN